MTEAETIVRNLERDITKMKASKPIKENLGTYTTLLAALKNTAKEIEKGIEEAKQRTAQ
jgi:hypothetical protein